MTTGVSIRTGQAASARRHPKHVLAGWWIAKPARGQASSWHEINCADSGPRAHVVVASGELDLHAVPYMDQTLNDLISGGRANLVLDMSAATFIDSAMIALLFRQLRAIRGGGGDLAIVCSNENVLATLEVSGFATVVQILRALSDDLVERVAAIPKVHPRSKFVPAPCTHALRVTADPSELARARSFSVAAARRAGFDPRRQYNLALATHEAVANAIEHGRPCRSGGIEIWADHGHTGLTIGVRDGGEFVLGPAPTDPLCERGRGLMLMSAFVDELSLQRESAHTVVRLTIRRHLPA